MKQIIQYGRDEYIVVYKKRRDMYYHQAEHTFVLGLTVGFFEGPGVGGDVGCIKTGIIEVRTVA